MLNFDCLDQHGDPFIGHVNVRTTVVLESMGWISLRINVYSWNLAIIS